MIIDRYDQSADDAEWQIDLPAGEYAVEVVYSEPQYDPVMTSGCKLQGVSASVGQVSTGNVASHFATAVVGSDGKLTFAGHQKRQCHSISSIAIEQTSLSASGEHPLLSKTAYSCDALSRARRTLVVPFQFVPCVNFARPVAGQRLSCAKPVRSRVSRPVSRQCICPVPRPITGLEDLK